MLGCHFIIGPQKEITVTSSHHCVLTFQKNRQLIKGLLLDTLQLQLMNTSALHLPPPPPQECSLLCHDCLLHVQENRCQQQWEELVTEGPQRAQCAFIIYCLKKYLLRI